MPEDNCPHILQLTDTLESALTLQCINQANDLIHKILALLKDSQSKDTMDQLKIRFTRIAILTEQYCPSLFETIKILSEALKTEIPQQCYEVKNYRDLLIFFDTEINKPGINRQLADTATTIMMNRPIQWANYLLSQPKSLSIVLFKLGSQFLDDTYFKQQIHKAGSFNKAFKLVESNTAIEKSVIEKLSLKHLLACYIKETQRRKSDSYLSIFSYCCCSGSYTAGEKLAAAKALKELTGDNIETFRDDHPAAFQGRLGKLTRYKLNQFENITELNPKTESLPPQT